MKNTDLDPMPKTPSQPMRITRRSFIKKTSSTVLVTALALHAFRAEAAAAEAGGSSLCIQIDSFPDWATDQGAGPTKGKLFASKSSAAKFLTGGLVNGWKLEARIEINPGSAKAPYKSTTV